MAATVPSLVLAHETLGGASMPAPARIAHQRIPERREAVSPEGCDGAVQTDAASTVDWHGGLASSSSSPAGKAESGRDARRTATPEDDPAVRITDLRDYHRVRPP